ncbi:MAG: hypothetical protein EBU67_10130 [Actinobacteria bacterium]|jgi:plasmid stability protein|nr:hypothetical protein [Actinomycetota bacterium]
MFMHMAALQVRNLPQDLHDRLRQRAETENRSISDIVIQILNRELTRPKMHEWLDLVAKTPDVPIPADEIVAIIHEGRAER